MTRGNPLGSLRGFQPRRVSGPSKFKIPPGDFGSGDSSSSAFKTKKSGWVKIYIIAITVIGVVAVAALVLILLQG